MTLPLPPPLSLPLPRLQVESYIRWVGRKKGEKMKELHDALRQQEAHLISLFKLHLGTRKNATWGNEEAALIIKHYWDQDNLNCINEKIGDRATRTSSEMRRWICA